jgi:hypothetical protein
MTKRKQLKQIKRSKALIRYKNIQRSIAKYNDSPKRLNQEEGK